ncbi:chemoreceptor glutamine deamidase CheD [Aliikangiella coralliicola]|uniref:Probable chemoreceptor glutamine deamidase CheD n=1 Tax=Aliikangiella coralliicola TaxID=2592383 RepID=A0A545UB68_9GAMM|nr:chemoreceptor glutamine deamidase CheD [Aliikangiella coralliicola]TQV86712.1 chemoreceptor glutamine deamidase CheD [Aliikangiella coralliicola]
MAVGFSRENLPSCWQEFNHINRYWDKNTGLPTAKILPGEFYVTMHNEAITTVLGSCISACIRDPGSGLGGMNHFMLPVQGDNTDFEGLSSAARYGNFAMEQMINDILRNGGRREKLEIKIFGGGKVMRGMMDVGKRNIAFAKEYIEVEKLNLVAEDVGGMYPRKVVYFPKTGKVLIKKLYSKHNSTIEDRDENYFSRISKQEVAGDVELFD